MEKLNENKALYAHLRGFINWEKRLDEVQKGCRSRLLEMETILKALDISHKWKILEGAKIVISAGKPAGWHKGKPVSTVFIAMFSKGKWELQRIWRMGYAPTSNQFHLRSYEQGYLLGMHPSFFNVSCFVGKHLIA